MQKHFNTIRKILPLKSLKELDRVEKDLIIVSKKLSDSKFVERATKEIVDKTRTQRQNLSEMKNKLLVAKKFANEL